MKKLNLTLASLTLLIMGASLVGCSEGSYAPTPVATNAYQNQYAPGQVPTNTLSPYNSPYNNPYNTQTQLQNQALVNAQLQMRYNNCYNPCNTQNYNPCNTNYRPCNNNYNNNPCNTNYSNYNSNCRYVRVRSNDNCDVIARTANVTLSRDVCIPVVRKRCATCADTDTITIHRCGSGSSSVSVDETTTTTTTIHSGSGSTTTTSTDGSASTTTTDGSATTTTGTQGSTAQTGPTSTITNQQDGFVRITITGKDAEEIYEHLPREELTKDGVTTKTATHIQCQEKKNGLFNSNNFTCILEVDMNNGLGEIIPFVPVSKQDEGAAKHKGKKYRGESAFIGELPAEDSTDEVLIDLHGAQGDTKSIPYLLFTESMKNIPSYEGEVDKTTKARGNIKRSQNIYCYDKRVVGLGYECKLTITLSTGQAKEAPAAASTNPAPATGNSGQQGQQGQNQNNGPSQANTNQQNGSAAVTTEKQPVDATLGNNGNTNNSGTTNVPQDAAAAEDATNQAAINAVSGDAKAQGVLSQYQNAQIPNKLIKAEDKFAKGKKGTADERAAAKARADAYRAHNRQVAQSSAPKSEQQ